MKNGTEVKRQREYDIATVKLLLFSYNIYLFNVLFLSYKLSFVFVHESIQKRQSTVRRLDISLLFARTSGEALARALCFSPSYYTEFFLFFFTLVEPLCGLMNTGGAFNDRSIHTMNASCLFLYYYLAVRNNRALSLPLRYTIWVLSSLVRYEKRYIDLGEAARNHEIVRAKNPDRYISGGWGSRSILAALWRYIVSPFPFKRIYRAHEITELNCDKWVGSPVFVVFPRAYILRGSFYTL